MSGGTSDVEYFVSGRYAREDGSFGLEDLGPARDVNEKRQASATLSFFGAEEKLRLRLSGLYSELDHRALNVNNTIHGAWPVSYRAKIRLADEEDRPYGNPFISTVREGMQIQNRQDATNFSGSLNLRYDPVPELSVDGTLGVSRVSQRDVQLYPYGWNVDIASARSEGRRDLGVRDHREVTAELKSSWNADPTPRVSSALTVGSQTVVRQTDLSGGRAEVFPGPGLRVGSAAFEQILDETFLRNATAGVFLQEQIGYRDVAFLTLGSRFDANSAFGERFSFAHYPKASVSVVPSDLPGWSADPVSTLRIRAAVGRSGLQPGTFDRLTTFRPVSSSEGPGIGPDNLGNPGLRPEISTEWEVGGEVGLLDDRVGVELTYWDRRVDDALVAREYPVSGGFAQPQLDNVGRLDAHGVELAVDGTAYGGRRLTAELFASAAYLSETVTDMGGAPPLKVGGSYVRYRNWVKEGYAPGSFFGPRVADAAIPLDLANDCTPPTRDEALAYFERPRSLDDFEVLVAECGTPAAHDQYLGKPTPDWQGSFGATVDVLDDFRLSTLFEFRAGDFRVHDLSGAFRRSNRAVGRNTPEAARIEATVADPSSTAEERLDAAIRWTSFRALSPLDGLNEVHRADFLRWRELSLTYAPAGLAERAGFRRLSLTLGARNLHLWVHGDYTGLDPEINQLGRCDGGGLDCNFLDSVEAWGLPLARRLSVRLTVEP